MKVIGTAGHVDHGKSTLVLALTGIDPDRLAEEKAREMTIDLGFAWLTLPDGETVGVIDVPGHIDFIKNMLAGVGGIDAALFVIAADEGVMPQTREHLAILDLLEVNVGVVALTKVDMIRNDPDWLELVQADVAEALEGTALAGAPIVPVSARTGQGLDILKATIAGVLSHVPQRRDTGKPRLPVDRAFSVAGFGTVVTGTLSDGALEVGQEVELVPSGLRARVRGLQTHKQKIERAVPGSRVAVNLSGVSKEQVNRGDVVALPGALRPTVLVDVTLRMVAGLAKALEHNQPVDLYCGSAEVEARTRLLGAESLGAGETGWVQLRLASPVAVQRGDRFILRQASPSRTLGGGTVVNPYPGRRWRRFRPEVLSMLRALESGDPPGVFEQALRREEPATYSQVLATSSLDKTSAFDAFLQLVRENHVVVLDKDWTAPTSFDADHETSLGVTGAGDWGEGDISAADKQRVAGLQSLLTAETWADLQRRLQVILAGFHRQAPLRPGMPREELKSRLQGKRQTWSLRFFNDLVGRLAAEGVVGDEGAVVRLADHEVRLSAKQQADLDRLLKLFTSTPYTPPSVAECIATVGDDVFQWLLDSGRLVRVGEDVVFAAESYEAMLQRIMDFMRTEGSITVAQVRDMFGTSRKYALALMEHLDAKHVTRRVGDERVLRKGGATNPSGLA